MVTFPATHVIPRTSNSGEASARSKASASSIPVSTSRMTLRAMDQLLFRGHLSQPALVSLALFQPGCLENPRDGPKRRLSNETPEAFFADVTLADVRVPVLATSDGLRRVVGVDDGQAIQADRRLDFLNK